MSALRKKPVINHVYNRLNRRKVQGIAGFWPLNEGGGTIAYDRSRYGKNGTLTGSPVPVAMKSGLGWKFNGTSQYIDAVGTGSSFNFIQNTGIFTIIVFARFNDYTANALQVFLGNSPSASSEKGFMFYYDNRSGINTKYLGLSIVKGSAGTPVINTGITNAIADNYLHALAVTGDGTSLVFYIDGIGYAAAGTMGSKSTGDATRAANIARYPFTVPAGYFGGDLGNLLVFNRTLNASEIMNISRDPLYINAAVNEILGSGFRPQVIMS